ncbi:MAG: potassium channel family protein [Candidatus Helarchaeota archaeon]
MNVLVIGGGMTGFETARILRKHNIDVKIIEIKEKTCENISERLPNVKIFCGDARIPDVLEASGIKESEVLIAVTDDQATNVLIGNLAKIYGVKRILVRVREPQFKEACKKMGIEELIDPAEIVAQYIMAHLRGFELVKLIEQIITYADVMAIKVSKDSPYLNKHIRDIKFPKNNHLIAIFRREKVEIPEHNIKLQEHDVLFFLHLKSLKDSITEFIHHM